MEFELTPKVLANFSPGFARSENPGIITKKRLTLKGFSSGEPFQGFLPFQNLNPGLSLRPNPGLKLANAFGVNLTALPLAEQAEATANGVSSAP
jgi:hypothetical protein